MDLYKKIVQNDVKYPKKVGPQALDLIRKLLHPSQTERLGSMKNGADDVKKHPFFRKLAWQSPLSHPPPAPALRFSSRTPPPTGPGCGEGRARPGRLWACRVCVRGV